MAYDPTIPALENYIGDDIPKIMANFAELAGSRIVEMGSNSNGEYVRWENGLQVCTFTHPNGISVDPGSYAYYDWTPPAQFVEFYAVLMVPHTGGGDLSLVSLTYGVLSSNTRAVLRNNAITLSRIMYPRFIAIGRWK